MLSNFLSFCRTMTMGLLLIGVFAGIAAYAQTPATDAKTAAPDEVAPPVKIKGPKPVEYKGIVYGKESAAQQVIDVYVNPTGKPAPVLVYYHGGAWWKGNRPASYGSFRAFLAMGFSVVSVEYRLTDTAVAPAAVQDARCVLAWVKKNAAQYNFDVNRIVPYGTSAGGHLALMAGMMPIPSNIDSCTDVPKSAAILDFYGPAQLVAGQPGVFPSSSVRKWIGEKPDKAEYARLMSPMNYVRKGDPPVFIAHGGSDPTVPHETSVLLSQALEKEGVPVDFYTVPDGLHGGFPPEQMEIIYKRVQAFLQGQGVLPK